MTNPPANLPLDSSDSVAVGLVLGAHGREGALNVRVLSDVPGRLDPDRVVHIAGRPHSISRSQPSGPNSCRVWLKGVSTRDSAAKLRGELLMVPEGEVPSAPEDEYFHYQLLGMSVRTEDGEALGALEEILETGSNDVYVVRGPGGEVLVPALATVVLQVDVDGAEMVVRLPEGLR